MYKIAALLLLISSICVRDSLAGEERDIFEHARRMFRKLEINVNITRLNVNTLEFNVNTRPFSPGMSRRVLSDEETSRIGMFG